MKLTCMQAAIALGLGMAVSSQATAQSLGEFEYTNSCAVCHGASGKGDGPVTDFLSGAAPSDLTVLQKNNGGVFPVTDVYAVIEGNGDVGLHGTRDMPIWGSRYRYRVNVDPDFALSPEETEAYVRTRILALIEYLSTLQEQ